MALDALDREPILQTIIHSKPLLKQFYKEHYLFYQQVLAKCPLTPTLDLELGSGAGFVKTIIPTMLTSDYLGYTNVDKIIDACDLPFKQNTVRFIGMINVLHHIHNPRLFFQEADRVLAPGGRIAIVDQHHGWLSRFILRYAHHEPYRPKAKQWAFPSTGPLSDANGAMAWMIFKRDKKIFDTLFPRLQLIAYTPHTPLRYWLIGGLKKWCLLHPKLAPLIKIIDTGLLKCSPQFGSFVNIEIEKI